MCDVTQAVVEEKHGQVVDIEVFDYDKTGSDDDLGKYGVQNNTESLNLMLSSNWEPIIFLFLLVVLLTFRLLLSRGKWTR